ncbi:MAG TPA: recombinase family protein [Candidatus Acidoferrum sp.]|nr:recombinase family protein [Candidatus Acidoferrum sp.]
MNRVIELIRVSTEGQAADDRASIPAQRAINRRTASQYQLDIVKSIEISDVSGASVLKAPEIRELIDLMQSPDIHGVVTREFSRLMRPENFADYALLQAFVDSKTILYLPDGAIDLASKTGRLLGTLRAAMAGVERTESLERIWAAKEEKRRRGELAQSEIVLPWGIGYDKSRGFFYKPESERVREAFRQFRAGNHNYARLAKLVGVTPRGMHIIMRNPIWMGFRVIDKKRDTSEKGRYPTKNGRQADRRKIARLPDEVIRVRVIQEPLISEAEFLAIQRIMDLKEKKHWRSRPDYEHRFTYNGCMTCSRCEEPIQTAKARRDYYLCKGRRAAHTCDTKYMAREKLELILDDLFSVSLTKASFLEGCIAELVRRSETDDSHVRVERLTSEITNLQRKRDRILDSFVDGVLSREERDDRLRVIKRDIQIAQEMLMQERPPVHLDVRLLTEALSPLAEWHYWSRDQKRNLLAALVPDIRVANYEVESLGLNPLIFSHEVTRTGKDSWLPPA